MAAEHSAVPGAHDGPARARLAELLERLLRTSPDATARELVAAAGAQSLRTDKAVINRVLYSHPGRFRSDGATPPRWHLVGGTSAPAGSPVNSTPEGKLVEVGAPTSPGRRAVSPDLTADLYAWQQEALDAWRAQHCRGVVEAVTGTGKTMVGLAATADAVKRGGKVQIVVPTLELLRQWTAQVRSQLPGVVVGQLGGGAHVTLDSCQVVISTVQSARSYDANPVPAESLLVADECHRYGADEFSKALNDRFPKRLGLSATYERTDNGNDAYLDPYFGGTCFVMNYARAIAEEVTAHFRVALIAVRFSGGERNAYEDAHDKATKARQWLVHREHVRAEPFGEFMKDVSAIAAGAADGVAVWKARAYLSAFAERKRILADTPAKQDKLKDLLPAIQAADRSIVFAQTIEAAERAVRVIQAGRVTAEAIHANLNPQARRLALDRFADGRLKAITAPLVLDEGIDVPAADLAVILAASRTRRQMIQRMGRVLRRKADGRLARFALLYVEGTSEDPANGAHGDFLEEITSVADEVRDYPVSAPAIEVCGFLNDFRASRIQPPARMARDQSPQPLRMTQSGTQMNSSLVGSSDVSPVGAPNGSTKPAKRERDRHEAESRGISVTQLLEARRAEVARNLRLHERATELGITVKELRKRGLDI